MQATSFSCSKRKKKAQVFLDELTKVIPSFGMHFAPTKCKDGDRVILTVPGWRHYKIWLPTDVSGAFVVSFYPDCLSECLEVQVLRSDCVKLALSPFRVHLYFSLQ
ncbi:hypothetical protein T265_12140 [Opisthorchis viverrini]|uniref:Uncharacterized protein n=1 Tax=Opisthorchis viverrini TaxID=6198 RepID=A0A074YVX6_OPIVI|nr:hypothetical protein T265_12140 [Opisthorchis viverrini]KER18828.1 hypothetical protein T265_12140 [Opisthorchis viverrini]